ncbi:MAG: hypothetical protein HUK02_00150 [Bacteroidaceae bacterium]|nr:hypothetical protein [Bacteroidaceae bacterium]
MIRRFSLFMMLMLTLTTVVCAQQAVGFSNGQCGRNNLTSIGSADVQGQMMRLSADKVKALVGAKLTGVSVVVGSRNCQDYDVFVRTSPEGANLAHASIVPAKANVWADYAFDAAYTVTGNEPALYVGYTCKAGNYQALSYDLTQDSKDVSFAYNEGVWQDTYGMSLGMPNVRVLAEGTPASADLMLKTYTQQGYYKGGQDYQHSIEVFNFGQKTITAFDAVVRIGDGAQQRISVADISLAANATHSVELPTLRSDDKGYQQVTVTLDNIATADGALADAEPSDNATAAAVFFYPADVQKNILLEGFTGQACPNCPAGHRAEKTAIESLESKGVTVYEVTHHAGYEPDAFSMEDDGAYCFFYGSNSTFAPAVMLNRWRCATLSSKPGPILNADALLIEQAALSVLDREPYVQMNMTSDYDAATNTAKIAVDIECLRLPSCAQTVFNIMLSQDSIIAPQSNGGSGYVHNAVARGNIVGSAWGRLVSLKEGETLHYETNYTLPASIESTAGTSYEGFAPNIATEASNMKLTAYVAAYSENDYNGNEVFNCVQIPLVKSATGISAVNSDVRNVVRYNLSGQRVGEQYKGIVIANGKKIVQ